MTSPSEYLSSVKWMEESFSPKEFSANIRLPQVGKIIRGQVLSEGLGVPSSTSPSLNQLIFWTRVESRTKVIGQCVKFKDVKGNGSSIPRAVTFGPRLEITDDYEGWFEILSEDGRSVRMIESVAELVKRFPRQVLVRESLKVSLGKKVGSEEYLSDKTRIIEAGDVLSLETMGSFCSKNPSEKYLKCVSSSGETLFMRTDQKGKFSPIARGESISGVHSIKNLSVKRLPIMVRLVHGSHPTSTSFKGFSGSLRLTSAEEEVMLLGVPLLKDSSTLVQVPLLSASLRIVPPKNTTQLESLPQYKDLILLASSACTPTEKTIQVMNGGSSSSPSLHHRLQQNHHHFASQDNIYEEVGKSVTLYDHRGRFPPATNTSSPLVKKDIPVKTLRNVTNCNDSCSLKENSKTINEGNKMLKESSLSCSGSSSSSSMDSAYEEIDQIYDYIRGFAPLPDNIRKELQQQKLASSFPSPSLPSRLVVRDQRRLSYPSGEVDSAIGMMVVPVGKPVPSFQLGSHHLPSNHHPHSSHPLHHPSHPHPPHPLHPPHLYSGNHHRHVGPHALRHNHPSSHHASIYDVRRPLRSNSLGRMMFPSDENAINFSMRNSSSPPSRHHQQQNQQNPRQRNFLPQPPCLSRSQVGPVQAIKSKLFVKRSATTGLQQRDQMIEPFSPPSIHSGSKKYHFLRYSSSPPSKEQSKETPCLKRSSPQESREVYVSPSAFLPHHHQHQPSHGPGMLPPPPHHVSPLLLHTSQSPVNPCNRENKPSSGGGGGSSGRSQMASPLFNIRYKSMTNVNSSSPSSGERENNHPGNNLSSSNYYINNNTLNSTDSSQNNRPEDAGGCLSRSTSSSSGEGERQTKTKLSKPKSLSNILRELTSVLASPTNSEDPFDVEVDGDEDDDGDDDIDEKDGRDDKGRSRKGNQCQGRKSRKSYSNVSSTESDSNTSSIGLSSNSNIVNINNRINNGNGHNNNGSSLRDDDKGCVNDMTKIDSRNLLPPSSSPTKLLVRPPSQVASSVYI